MKTTVNLNYNENDFTKDEIVSFQKAVKRFEIQGGSYTLGYSFILKGMIFTITNIIVDLKNDIKNVILHQQTSSSKIIKPN